MESGGAVKQRNIEVKLYPATRITRRHHGVRRLPDVTVRTGGTLKLWSVPMPRVAQARLMPLPAKFRGIRVMRDNTATVGIFTALARIQNGNEICRPVSTAWEHQGMPPARRVR